MHLGCYTRVIIRHSIVKAKTGSPSAKGHTSFSLHLRKPSHSGRKLAKPVPCVLAKAYSNSSTWLVGLRRVTERKYGGGRASGWPRVRRISSAQG